MKELLLMAGIAAAKAREFRKAERYLREAVKLDASDLRAKRLLRRVHEARRSRRSTSLVSFRVQVGLLVLMLAQVVGVWILMTLKIINLTQFAVLLPTLIGLLMVVFVLPRLTQLKVVGFEAKIDVQVEVSPAEALLHLTPGELKPLFDSPLGLPPRR